MMHLSAEELVRLEQMFDSGRVRSEPTTLSATDRMMDAMIAAAQLKTDLRRARRAIAQGRCEPPPTPRTPETSRVGHDDGAVADRATGAKLLLDWKLPRTLDELILIRQSLLDNHRQDV